MYIHYTMPLRFSEADFTAAGTVRASRILHAFQDIARAHAASAGLGFDELIAQNLIWVITKYRFRVSGALEPGTEYTLLSYPRRTGSLIYDRDFHILSPTGEEPVTGTSQWCIVNAVTRHAVQTDLDFPGVHNPEPAMPEGIARIRPRDLTPAGRHTVTSADLDENDHTNNCRYADMALEVLGLESVRELTMNFAAETRLGDEIQLYTAPGGIAAGKHNGELVFTARGE